MRTRRMLRPRPLVGLNNAVATAEGICPSHAVEPPNPRIVWYVVPKSTVTWFGLAPVVKVHT